VLVEVSIATSKSTGGGERSEQPAAAFAPVINALVVKDHNRSFGAGKVLVGIKLRAVEHRALHLLPLFSVFLQVVYDSVKPTIVVHRSIFQHHLLGGDQPDAIQAGQVVTTSKHAGLDEHRGCKLPQVLYEVSGEMYVLPALVNLLRQRREVLQRDLLANAFGPLNLVQHWKARARDDTVNHQVGVFGNGRAGVLVLNQCRHLRVRLIRCYHKLNALLLQCFHD
jgi:hypothetical protein